ncbi:PIG-L family deacetylase [Muriicola marianensis]|uniref:GlcNAc-PI de-N-acetylase n=1 Tax=Muriicola marianensis TaxID=1324801 RepID=A0ABQ1QQ81_9FLAO|nr:PIG-L family deacetylase [Muriicola marianensis]GGD40491.1 GlcNAc-PI de-N-acetylase [Muriicola marianensis]
MGLKFRLFLSFFAVLHLIYGQSPSKPSSTDIYHSLQKLNFLGSAMYIAAHPDDENTRLISYLSNQVHARTAYLSITRGDGGQNLIGPELRELLGVLRTQELLAARRVDGGTQFFTRANDFGYSKHPDETLKIWDKEAVLGDVVHIIREFKPDVIINRFDHRTPGSTHGHHTSSAVLSVEAFDLVSNPKAYPEQLQELGTWSPKRLFFNTSWWFYGSQENFEKADKSRLIELNTGVFYPVLGMSNNEIASIASSQHRCQGFGRPTTRGNEGEYIELLKGEMPKQQATDLFEGIDTSWSRIEGGEAIGKILYEVEENFDFKDPSKHLNSLLKAYQLLQNVRDEHWKSIKLPELKELITHITGLYLEASSDFAYSNPESSVNVDIESVNRSDASIVLQQISIGDLTQINPGVSLENNDKKNYTLTFEVPPSTSYSSPYWLNKKGSLGMYRVEDFDLIGLPETPPAFEAKFLLEVNGVPLEITRSVVYRYSRPEKGELYSPFNILPPASLSIRDKVLIFDSPAPRQIDVVVRALRDKIEGSLKLDVPQGWGIDRNDVTVSLQNKGEERIFSFMVTPPEGESEGIISPVLMLDGEKLTQELVTIAYDHIPTQEVLLPSETKVVRLDIKKVGQNIGYIMGAGDEIPSSLEQIGYTVHELKPEEIQMGTLGAYDAIVVGIRAYNVIDEMRFKQDALLDYVNHGGNLVVQYNTSGRSGLDFDNLAPYPIHISRDRVTEEDSPVEILNPNHPLMSFPNKVTKADFQGWVQERGLYFPDTWDKAFTPVLSMADQGESPKEGSLLIASYGKGTYIYTGLSFFRELPAGVPGAFKLFANMLSQNKAKLQQEPPVKGK